MGFSGCSIAHFRSCSWVFVPCGCEQFCQLFGVHIESIFGLELSKGGVHIHTDFGPRNVREQGLGRCSIVANREDGQGGVSKKVSLRAVVDNIALLSVPTGPDPAPTPTRLTPICTRTFIRPTYLSPEDGGKCISETFRMKAGLRGRNSRGRGMENVKGLGCEAGFMWLRIMNTVISIHVL